MAVYTKLDDAALTALWSAYDDEAALLRAEGIAAGSINTTYRLVTDAGVFYLRINEGKSTDDVWYERDLLARLASSSLGATTPTIKQTRIGDSFFLIERRLGSPVWAAIFPELPGRDLGVVEVKPSHAEQVGRFLARAHRALIAFPARAKGEKGRPNPAGLPAVAGWLRELEGVAETAETAARLRVVLERVRAERPLLPRGVIHGDLFVDNTKWLAPEAGGKLAAVFDWEMAGKDHLALDLAVCLHAWCWVQQDRAFDVDRCRALLAGYEQERVLAPSERRGLYVEALLAAVRFTASRMRDFDVPHPERAVAQRNYLDHRDFLQRLDALQVLGQRGFRRLVGIA